MSNKNVTLTAGMACPAPPAANITRGDGPRGTADEDFCFGTGIRGRRVAFVSGYTEGA